ncbi:hypothetical protein [Nevskia ramosa]|uniref:hypothetical protein n=1 Tax=Nevskia ramosa TaxID=64002 RepID=UPI003D0D1D74
MSHPFSPIADAPLLLIAAVWLSSGLRNRDPSARLELLAASLMLASASAVLWNALGGAAVMWTTGFSHLVLVLVAIVVAGLGQAIPAEGFALRSARYAAGVGLSGIVLAASLGQYAPSA